MDIRVGTSELDDLRLVLVPPSLQFWTSDFGPWTLDSEFWTLDFDLGPLKNR